MIREKRHTKETYKRFLHQSRENTSNTCGTPAVLLCVFASSQEKERKKRGKRSDHANTHAGGGVREEGHLAFESIHDGVRDEEGVVNTCDCSVRQKEDEKLCVCCTNAFFFPNHTMTI